MVFRRKTLFRDITNGACGDLHSGVLVLFGIVDIKHKRDSADVVPRLLSRGMAV